ncbi:MAG: 5' nucleotidase, NT5C type [Alkaliphilus sp.]
MGRLNLCVDIDGTITMPFYWLKYANDYFGTNLKPSDITEYDIDKVLNIPADKYWGFYELYGKEMHEKARARKGAKENLIKLAKNNNIHYVTARNKVMYDVTNNWIDKRKLPKTSLHLLGSHNKVLKAKELDCNVFIEDRYENAMEISEAGFRVLLIDCFYNRFELPKRVTRVKNWNEIYDEISLYETKKSRGFRKKGLKVAIITT